MLGCRRRRRPGQPLHFFELMTLQTRQCVRRTGASRSSAPPAGQPPDSVPDSRQRSKRSAAREGRDPTAHFFWRSPTVEARLKLSGQRWSRNVHFTLMASASRRSALVRSALTSGASSITRAICRVARAAVTTSSTNCCSRRACSQRAISSAAKSVGVT
jgi:hypothetical protein